MSLIEAVVSAYRERVRGEVRDAPEWHDLNRAERVQAFEVTLVDRTLRAALDPDHLSPTAHAVLQRIRQT